MKIMKVSCSEESKEEEEEEEEEKVDPPAGRHINDLLHLCLPFTTEEAVAQTRVVGHCVFCEFLLFTWV